MRTAISITLIMLTFRAFGQDTTTFFYTSKWELTTNSETASYYGKMWKNNEGSFNVIDYYMSGQIQMTGVYKSMKTKVKHGLFSYYYETGIKKVEGQYAENLTQGEWKYWDEEGRLTGITTYINGKVVKDQSFHPNGNPKYSGSVKNDLKTGTWQHWDHNGRLIFEGQYIKGLRSGDWIRHLPDTTITVSYLKGTLLNDTGSLIRKRDQGRRIYNN